MIFKSLEDYDTYRINLKINRSLYRFGYGQDPRGFDNITTTEIVHWELERQIPKLRNLFNRPVNFFKGIK